MRKRESLGILYVGVSQSHFDMLCTVRVGIYWFKWWHGGIRKTNIKEIELRFVQDSLNVVLPFWVYGSCCMQVSCSHLKGMYVVVTTDTHLEDELAHILSHMKTSLWLSTMSWYTKTFLSLFLDGTEPGVLEIAFEDSKFCFGHKKTSMLEMTVKKFS